MHAIAVEMQLLLIDRNKNLLRPFCRLAKRILLGTIAGLGSTRFVRGSMLVPTAIPAAAIPISRGRRSCRRHYRQGHQNPDRAASAAIIPPRPLVVGRASSHQFAPSQYDRTLPE